MKRIITVCGLVAAAAVLLLLARMGAGRPPRHVPIQIPESPAPVISQTAPRSVQEQMAGLTDVRLVRITDQGFEPGELRITVGGEVRIHLVNESSAPHNLVLNRFGIVTRMLAPGEENFIAFTANAKGDWPFISDGPGDAAPAFGGTLKVE